MGKAARNRTRAAEVRRAAGDRAPAGQRQRGVRRLPAAGMPSGAAASADSHSDALPDRFLPGFTRGQAGLLRGGVMAAVQALGYRAADRGDHIRVTGGPFRGAGAQLGFATLANKARCLPEEEWADMTDDHVRQVIAAALQGSSTPGSLGYAGTALRERLFPRFIAPQRMDPVRLAEDYTYARDVGGLPLGLAIRRDQTSLLLGDIHLAKAGGAAEAWEAAEANLFAAGIGEPTVYGKGSAAVVLFEGEHPRMASWLAYPQEFLARIGLEPGPLGVLLSVPALRQIAVQPLTEHSTVEHVAAMLGFNRILGEHEVAPLSPHVFHWRPGGPVTAATTVEPEGLALTLPRSVMEAVAGKDSGAWEVPASVQAAI
ncbi:hypothetical protein [Sinomonas halotolerans]|uniref:Uncharacterized protein n=1 Tax=Sinomonas halotolerans TaxID=1644133 RepID=A0ABU9WV94_9MICC